MEATRLRKNMESNLKEMELQLSRTSWWGSGATKSLGQLQVQIKVFSNGSMGVGNASAYGGKPSDRLY